MLANVGGSLALGLGLVVLLLPLLTPELSRPRDAAWGALVLLLGLALVTSSDRLTGSPMVVVVCAGLLIGRLATEVGQARWRQLSPEEQQRLGSVERCLRPWPSWARRGWAWWAKPVRSQGGWGVGWPSTAPGAGAAPLNAGCGQPSSRRQCPWQWRFRLMGLRLSRLRLSRFWLRRYRLSWFRLSP
jgi:hypothetical protein